MGAAVDWCETDPLEVIVAPGGSSVPVYVTNAALGTEHLPAVQVAVVSGQAMDLQFMVNVP